MGWQLHRRVQLLRSLTHRVCLNGEPLARRELHGAELPARPTPEHSQVALLNFAKAKFKGTQAAGAHLGLTFLCAQKGESPAGAKSRHLREAQKSLTKSADTICSALSAQPLCTERTKNGAR